MARRKLDVPEALALAEGSLEQLRERRKWLLAEIAEVELEIEGLKRAIQRADGTLDVG